MNFRSNGVRLNGDSVKRCSVKWCFGQKAFGQKKSMKWLFGSDPEPKSCLVWPKVTFPHYPKSQLTKKLKSIHPNHHLSLRFSDQNRTSSPIYCRAQKRKPEKLGIFWRLLGPMSPTGFNFKFLLTTREREILNWNSCGVIGPDNLQKMVNWSEIFYWIRPQLIVFVLANWPTAET
jgi:hypothetical protein